LRAEAWRHVTESLFWGLVAGSSLVIGGAIALTWQMSSRVLGLVMAFGAGVLISAVAYDLVEDAVDTSAGDGGVAAGLFAGAITFAVGNEILERQGATDRKRSQRAPGGTALALVLGIVLDGVPESMVIGLTILDGGAVSAAVLAAVFISNLPEAVAATKGLTGSGWTRRGVMGLWLLVAAVTALASLAGYVVFDEASSALVAFVMAFAAGAILTMLAETMMPEAFEHAHNSVGLATTLGFALAFAISYME
jgi:zinc transporter, ZIP family